MGTVTDLEFQKADELTPTDLRLIRDFVNTVEYQVDEEGLTRPEDLSDWFVDRGLLSAGSEFTAADLELAKALREGLRSVLEMHAGHATDDVAMLGLDAVLAQLPMRAMVDDHGQLSFVAARQDPVGVGFGAVVDAIYRATRDGAWTRLKACARPSCRWAYYDSSRNRSSRWCTMSGCGNVVKMKRAYAARKGRETTTPSTV